MIPLSQGIIIIIVHIGCDQMGSLESPRPLPLINLLNATQIGSLSPESGPFMHMLVFTIYKSGSVLQSACRNSRVF